MADNMNGSIMEEDNSFGGRVKKAAKRVDNFWRGVADFINPNVAREGFTPSNIARDVNMWVEPVSQMALDEAQGRAEYPAWAFGLGSVPVLGKGAPYIAKVAGKATELTKPLMTALEKLGKGEGKIGGRNAEQNLVPAKDFVWKHPNGEIMTVRARDLDEATELINKEVEKIGGVPHTAEISDGSRGRYFVYANPTEDGYVLSGSRGKNDKYFDNLEEAQAYMNGFPKYDYERGLMDEYKFLKAPTMKRVSNDLAENARMVDDIVKADVSYGHKLSYMTNNELQKEYEKAIKNGSSKDVVGKIVREADSRGVKGTGSVFKVTGNGKYTFLDDRPNTGLLADTPAGSYNAEFVPGEGSIMEGARPKKYVMHYPDGGELEFESMEKLKEYADLLRKNVGVGGGFKIIER